MAINPETIGNELAAKYPQLDPARIAKAISIASKLHQMYNNNCPPGQFDVQSESGNGWYRVDTIKRSCTCTDSQTGHTCKHRIAVWIINETIRQTFAQVKESSINLAKHNRSITELGY